MQQICNNKQKKTELYFNPAANANATFFAVNKWP